jgi:Tol biopolymer transport system component
MGFFDDLFKTDSAKDGLKDGEKGREDPIRSFFDSDYKKGVDAEKGIRDGEKAHKEFDKHPISAPIVDALLGGFDTAGKSKDYERTYNKVKYGESPRKVFGDELKSFKDSKESSAGRCSSEGGGGGGGGGGFLVGFVVVIFLIGFVIHILDDLVIPKIETDVIKKIWPTYETSSEKTLRVKQEQKQKEQQWESFTLNSEEWLVPLKAVSSISEKIIFISSSEKGGVGIYLINPTTGDIVNLTEQYLGEIKNLALSPDSKKIVFISSQGERNTVRVLDPDGTKIVAVKPEKDFIETEAVRLSSSMILFTRQNHPYVKTIWMINLLNPYGMQMMIPSIYEYNNDWVEASKRSMFTFFSCENPTVSPKRDKIAFVKRAYGGTLASVLSCDNRIIVKDLQKNKEFKPKYFGAKVVQLGPQAWSPDGNKIAFSASLSDKCKNGIGILEINKQSVGKITWLNVSGKNPAWSLDGKWIAFDNEGTIYAFEVASGNVRKIVGPKFNGIQGENPLWILPVISTNSEHRNEISKVITIPKYSTTRTTFLRSLDDGKTWDTLLSVNNMPTLAIALIDSVAVNDSQSISVKLRGWVNEAIETEDGGKTWELINYHGKYYGSKTASLRTYDGGRTWQKLNVQYR